MTRASTAERVDLVHSSDVKSSGWDSISAVPGMVRTADARRADPGNSAGSTGIYTGHAEREHSRAMLANVTDSEYLALKTKHRAIVERKFKGGLSKREELDLRMLRWHID